MTQEIIKGSKWRLLSTEVEVMDILTYDGSKYVTYRHPTMVNGPLTAHSYDIVPRRWFEEKATPVQSFAEWLKELLGRTPAAKETLRAMLAVIGKNTVGQLTNEQQKHFKAILEEWERSNDDL